MFKRFDDKISTTQASIFLNNSVLGAGILTLPRSVTEAVKTPDIWISVLLGGCIAILVTVFMVKLSQQFPDNTIYQFSRRIAGTFTGGALSLFLIIYFVVGAGFEIRVLAEINMFFLLERTPIWAIMIPFIWLGAYVIFGGINSLARIYEIIFPMTIIILLISFLLSLKLFELDNLRPVMSEGVLPILKGIKPTILVFTGCEVVMILVVNMQHPERAVKAMIAGISIPFALYLFTVIVVIGGMSTDAVLNSTWSMIDILRSFEISGLIFERYEFPFLVIWMMQLFCSFTSFYYNATLGLSQVFRIKPYPVIFGLIPAVYVTAMLPKRINDVFKMGEWIGGMGITLFFLLPVMLAVILVIRKKGLKQHV